MERKAKKQQPQGKLERPWPIVSTKLPTGQLVETVYHADPPATRFLVGSHGLTAELGKVPAPGGGWYVPYSPRNNLLTHRVVLLPTAADEYQAEPLLRALVRGFIHRYVDLSTDFEEIAAHYVLFPWLFDDFSELPYLRVQGDYGSGKSRFLQTVGSLCYKPIFASGASTVSPLFRILDSVSGTLVIDEGDFRFSDEKADIIKILNNGNAEGFPVLRSEATPTGEYNPRAFRVFGPKLVATRGPFDDRALESRCITEVMGTRRLRRDVPLNLPPSFHAEALSLRNQLLLYRFRHAGEARPLETVLDRALEPRVAQVFGPLVATLDDEQSAERLARLARGYSRDLVGERRASVEADVLSVVEELRQQESGPIRLQVIAKTVATRHRSLYGDSATPRWIGSILRRLGLRPRKTEGTYALTPEDFPRLAGLVERYGIEVRDERDFRDFSEENEEDSV